jgi:hypothetical protein
MRKALAVLGVAVLAFAAGAWSSGWRPFGEAPSPRAEPDGDGDGEPTIPDAPVRGPQTAIESQAAAEPRPSPPEEVVGEPAPLPDPPEPPAVLGGTAPRPEPAAVADARAAMRAGLSAGTEDGRVRAQEAAKDVLSHDPDDREARRVLGHRRFRGTVPEMLGYRGDDFTVRVEAAAEKRWYAPEEAAALAEANRAWERLRAHAKRLATDPFWRAYDGERVRAERARPGLVWISAEARPFVVFYTDGTREEAGEAPTTADRLASLARHAEKRRSWKRALAEKAAILGQLQAEALRRWGRALDLRDLSTEFGGRPELPVSKRSFRDGFTVPVWCFATTAAYGAFFDRSDVDPRWAPHGTSHPHVAAAWLCDDASLDREERLQHHVRLAAEGLLVAFPRQRNEWGGAWGVRTPSLGMAAVLSSCRMTRDRRLEWHSGPSRTVRRQLDRVSKVAAGKPPPLGPLAPRLGLEGILTGYRSSRARREEPGPIFGGDVDVGHGPGFGGAIDRLRTAGAGGSTATLAAHLQCASIFAWLSESPSVERREAALRWVRTDWGAKERPPAEAVEAALGVAGAAGWAALDAEFATWWPSAWLAVDPASMGPPPPALEDWPGYREE